jgi:hypothetical protein
MKGEFRVRPERPVRLRFPTVTPSRKPGTVEGAYDLTRITAEIEHGRKKKGFSVKAAAEDSGMKRKDWYKKRNMEGSTFNLEDISRIVKVLDAPPGWPFLPWELAEDFEKWRDSRRG